MSPGQTSFLYAELERRKPNLKTQLVWIGAQKEPGLTSRTWKWVNGKLMHSCNIEIRALDRSESDLVVASFYSIIRLQKSLLFVGELHGY